MSTHALLSPSSAYRWLNCTPAARLEAQLPAQTNDYAKEGTLAHSVCEITAKKKFNKMKPAAYTRELKKLKTDPLWNDEMLHTADTYVEHLYDKAMGFNAEPYITFETKVDISDYVPEAFGRCDCIMFGEDTLLITDYKHGKGVSVEATENPQMMLYALGALKVYRPLFGDAIKSIQMCIDQPRLNIYDCWSCELSDLLAWGETIKQKAQMAFMGFGEYHSGSWCRFCRANGICKAQAEQHISAFNDFAGTANKSPSLLTPEEMAEVLKRGETLVEWYKSVKAKALEAILSGTKIPGYKAVEGRSNRTWSDQDKALEKLMKSGIERAVLFDSVPKTLAQIEKLLGKTQFTELVGQYVIKPPGSPALAVENDPKPAYHSAKSDFASVANTVQSESVQS